MSALRLAPLLSLALLCLPACRRDVAVPPLSTFDVADPFPSAAPGESLTLAATGGSPPYAFAFAGGRAASGAGAALEGATGAYRAGTDGPAIDVVEARDAGGARREIRVSVGPPLQVTPTRAFAAPGGTIGFVGSGGKPPYRLELLGAAQGTVSGTDFLVAASGGCGGPVREPATQTLRLVDATGTASTDLTVDIGRGLDLFPAAGAGAVAPNESIAFVASGGQPPYLFSMAANGSAGPGIDAGRGSYTAGPSGQQTDQVRVTDANGQQACFAVSVGPGLSFSFSNTRARPGQAMQVAASGGRPPYRYTFEAKGNRSRATLDAVTGRYVPGFNTGATDRIVVSDATGGPPAPAQSIRVGPVSVDATYPDQGCLVGDVDGNGVADAVTVSSYGVVSAVEYRSGAPARVAKTSIGNGSQSFALGDVDGDGRADFVTASRLDGALEVGRGQGDGTFGAVLRLPSLTVGQVAMARGSRRILVAGSAPGCSGLALAWVDHDAAQGRLAATGCVPLAAGMGSVTTLVAGDFDGDGQVDAAYTRSSAPETVSFRLAAEAYASEHGVALPAPWRVQVYALHALPALEVRPSGSAASSLLLLVYDGVRTAPGVRTGLATLRGGAGGLGAPQVDRVDFAGVYNVLGMGVFGLGPGATPRVGVSNGADGRVQIFDFPAAAGPLTLSAQQIPPREYRVAGLCGGDLDGDAIDDLLLGPRETLTSADVLLGDLDGGWGRRPRFHSLGTGLAGDLDADGRPDFVAPVPGLGLEVLFPVEGEIALGPSTPTDGFLFWARGGDWNGDGVPDLMTRVGATGFTLLPGLGDGSFGPPAPVAVASPDGVPYDPISVSFESAQLGGAAAGPDLVAYVRAGAQLSVAAFVFADATHATYGVSDLPLPADYRGLADLDGDGLDDFAEVNASAIRVAMLRPAVAGATWPFLPSVEVATFPELWPVRAGSIPVPGSPGRRLVIVHAGAILLVGAPAGAPEVTTLPITLAGNQGNPVPVGVADVTGDGWPDLVLVTTTARSVVDPLTGHVRRADLVVIRGTAAGGFEAAPDPALTVPLEGEWTGALLEIAGAVPDLLMTSPALSSVVLRNDGTGRFR